jgi:error-prone DNA polymerase
MSSGPAQALDDAVEFPAPAVAESVLADYASTGLTLRSPPSALLREQSDALPTAVKRQRDLDDLNDGRFVRVAGLVTCRQRPGTASGVLFLTLEDETGNNNVVVWPGVQERFRPGADERPSAGGERHAAEARRRDPCGGRRAV